MVKADVRKPSLFDDSDDESDGGAKLQVNAEFAKRFEHNKKREELHRCKYLVMSTSHPVSRQSLTKPRYSGGEIQIEADEWGQEGRG